MNQSLQRSTQYRSARQKKREEESFATIQAGYNCHQCYDAGWIGIKKPRGLSYGLYRWAEDNVPADDIEWCECDKGKEVRSKYETDYKLNARVRYQSRLNKLFHSAGVPKRFTDFTLELPPNLLNKKIRAYAACKMMIRDGMVVPARLGEIDQRAAIMPHEKIARPNHAFKSLTLSGPKGAGKTVALSLIHISEPTRPSP
mgnify:CR=1 FL=1